MFDLLLRVALEYLLLIKDVDTIPSKGAPRMLLTRAQERTEGCRDCGDDAESSAYWKVTLAVTPSFPRCHSRDASGKPHEHHVSVFTITGMISKKGNRSRAAVPRYPRALITCCCSCPWKELCNMAEHARMSIPSFTQSFTCKILFNNQAISQLQHT